MTHQELQQRSGSWPVPATGTPLASSAGFADFTEYLLSVRESALIRIGGSVKPTDQRLIDLNRRAIAAGSSEKIPVDGGFLVPPDFAIEILKRATDVGSILARTFRVTTTSNTYSFPQFDESSRAEGSRFGGVRIYGEDEADALIASKPKFMRSELIASRFTGLLYASNDVVADSNSFSSWCPYVYGEELGYKLESMIVNGSGVAGQFLGILNAPCLITVDKESGQTAATVVSENVDAMLSRLWPPSRKTAIWLYNSELLPSLRKLSTTVGAGGSESKLWQWASGTDEYDRLAGMVAIPSEYCGAPGSGSDLILFDPSRYIVVMRELLRTAVSIHILFLTEQSAFRVITRASGQPIDGRPIVPTNGSLTKSSCVVLAARP